ncbi:acyl-[acyl-carrier-protein] thioesterase [Dictyobacter arantiisoli]|uniref:Acyl-ACP thioesterase N-terminal hotdog domain-containing protein n=1 Tax=Dictyobacter arantiisoli TaxID=2014874 RepID=A0A5A5T872_9CHLR|nr:thioesterase family protein [Dictyobacter arantiisoli]GCF07547.1 hypothetical protein KDI_11110 [Dictyobacter arantiisoli]
MPRQFRHTYTVRYNECDCYGFLTPAAFVRYMQDIALLDAEDVRFTQSGFWIVKRSVITFHTPVPMHTELELTTFGMGFTRITGQRGYDARLVGASDGPPIISARTLWVYVDQRGRPIRMPEGTAEVWLPDGPQAIQAEPALPAFPEQPPAMSSAAVRFSDTDLMRHMNNAAYVEVLDNAAWEAYSQAEITAETATLCALSYDIEYLESALLGEQLEIQSWFDPFPQAGQEFTRLQQITRAGRVLVRTGSRWIWRPTA